MIRTLIFALMAASTTACAYNYAVPITDANRKSPGIRVYGTKPLLQVSASEVKVLFVPNYNEEYALRFGAFLAKNDVNIQLGPSQTLQSITAKPDGTALVTGLLDFAKEAVKQGADDLGDALFSGRTAGEVQVYDIIFNPDGSIRELRPLIGPDARFKSLDRPGFPTNPDQGGDIGPLPE
ncbi:hypothetical protein C8N43_3902 [Litoreibacter ponti]|uniref:Uncharacterized protein n=1 Tax=Litoreibacter ponti TaxID=1510457 RepID=A0A2T6BCS7_9RHOB|nr:hypothetical protein [Litoreibacter ponti]PTX53859.1 hypothetical protein C8N43_3902 [Litoreibacter ponti]